MTVLGTKDKTVKEIGRDSALSLTELTFFFFFFFSFILIIFSILVCTTVNMVCNESPFIHPSFHSITGQGPSVSKCYTDC